MMINEMSIMQQNKNVFNKLISKLKRYKNHPQKYLDKVMLNENLFSADFHMIFELEVKNIFTEQCNDWVYFLAEVNTKLNNIQYNYHRQEDPAFMFVKYHATMERGNWRAKESVMDAFEMMGLHCSPSLSDSEIQKSAPYKVLSPALDELRADNFDLVLRDKVHTRVKTRRNVLPLCYYKIEEDILNYPTSTLTGGLMSTSCRGESFLHHVAGNMDDKVRQIMEYTPWDDWTSIDFTNQNKIVNVKWEESYQNRRYR